MPAKYSAAVLVVIALFVWPATSAAIAGSRPKDVMPSSYATGVTNVTHIPVSSKRWIQPDVEMSVSNNIDEERVLPNELEKEIVQGLQAIYRDGFDGLFVDKPAEESLYSGFFSIVPSDPKMYKKVLNTIHQSLAKHFKDDLVGVLVAGTKIESDEKRIAKDLLSIEAAMWKKEKKTAEEVFKLLQLDKTEENLFENPLFSTWAKLFKSNGVLMYTKIFKFLQGIYKGDDDKLTRFLVAGTKIDGSSFMVNKLLNLQANQWKREKKTPAEVFKLLELDLTQGNLFENPLYYIWDNYASSRYAFPVRVKFLTLRSIYGDDVLTKLLVAGTKNEITRLIPATILELQVQKWKEEGTKTSEEVFKLLDLDKTEGNLFENPLFSTWATLFKNNVRLMYTKMFESLQGIYKGDDDKLTGLLVAGTKIEGPRVVITKTTSDSTSFIANILLDLQASQWKKEKKTVDEVFKLLQLDKTEGNLFENPLFSTWATFFKSNGVLMYTKMFESLQGIYMGNDDKLTRFLVAGTKIEGSSFMGNKLLDILVNNWKEGGKDSTEVFMLLELDRTQRNLFENPLYSKWVGIVEPYLNAAYTIMFATLQGLSKGDDVLARVLVAGKRIESTKLFAEHQLDILINKWKEGGKDATEVFMLLELDLIQGNLFESSLFSKWVDFVESRYPNDAYAIMSATLQAAFEGNDKLAGDLLARMSNKRRRISVPELTIGKK